MTYPLIQKRVMVGKRSVSKTQSSTQLLLTLFNHVCKDTEDENITTSVRIDYWVKLIVKQFDDNQTVGIDKRDQLNFFRNLMACAIPYIENDVTVTKLSLVDQIWMFLNRNNLKQARINFYQGAKLARILAFPTKEYSDLYIIPPKENERFSTIVCCNLSSVTMFNPDKLTTSLVNNEAVDIILSAHELKCCGLRKNVIYCYWWFYIGAKLRERFEQETGTIL